MGFEGQLFPDEQEEKEKVARGFLSEAKKQIPPRPYEVIPS